MRLAYELGFANSCLFTRGHVTFLSLDGIAFARPVPIGSLLRLTSNIVHSSSSDLYPALVVSVLFSPLFSAHLLTAPVPRLYSMSGCTPTSSTLPRVPSSARMTSASPGAGRTDPRSSARSSPKPTVVRATPLNLALSTVVRRRR